MIAAREYAARRHTVSWNLLGSARRIPANGTSILMLEGGRYRSRQVLRIIR